MVYISLVPRLLRVGGEKRAWYTLFAYAPSSLGNLHTTPSGGFKGDKGDANAPPFAASSGMQQHQPGTVYILTYQLLTDLLASSPGSLLKKRGEERAW